MGNQRMNKLLIQISLFILLAGTGCTALGLGKVSMNESSPDASPTLQQEVLTPIYAGHTLTIFAAASLTGAFQELAQGFEAANPEFQINFNFAGTQILRTQLEQGALADVFASADHKNMDILKAEHLVDVNTIQDFTTNSLIVILPPGNPGNVLSLADLARPKLKLILADASVPAGNYARQVLANISQDPVYGVNFIERVLANVVSYETDVKQVVTKVELGEADAGIVYTSDAVATPELPTLSIPTNINVTASYPIAVLNNAPEPKLAEAFVAYVISPTGKAILTKWGFGPVTH